MDDTTARCFSFQTRTSADDSGVLRAASCITTGNRSVPTAVRIAGELLRVSHVTANAWLFLLDESRHSGTALQRHVRQIGSSTPATDNTLKRAWSLWLAHNTLTQPLPGSWQREAWNPYVCDGPGCSRKASRGGRCSMDREGTRVEIEISCKLI